MDSVLGFLFVVLLALAYQVKFGTSAKFLGSEFEEDLEFQKPTATHYGSLSAEAVKALFEEFTESYNKVYLSSSEKYRRMKIFTENLKRYDEMNRQDMGTAVYGIDQFSDMTVEEFAERMLTLDAEGIQQRLGAMYDGVELDNITFPKKFDWRNKGAVSPVKNQGYCGSCWAFSAVGNLEGLWYRKHKTMEIFSEQQIVDCDTTSYGCDGGWMENAVKYIKDAGGLQLNETYPYTDNEQQCTFDKSKVVLKVKENINLPGRNEKKMAQYLFKNAPISVALDANAMFGYKNGIAHPPEVFCSKNETQVNHGLTLVGFGVKVIGLEGKKKKKMPYWIAKNSWSQRWGDKGYYYLYRGDSSCAIDAFPSSAVLA